MRSKADRPFVIVHHVDCLRNLDYCLSHCVVYGFWLPAEAVRYSIGLLSRGIEADQIEVAERGNPIILDAHNAGRIIYPKPGDVQSKLVNKK